MEELFCPMHMFNSYGFGDVLLTQRTPSGLLTTKNPLPVPCSGSIPNTTIKFASGGSGFLVSTRQSLKIGSSFILGLILTAANVVCEVLTNEPKNNSFGVKLENGQWCEAYFLKSYLDEFSQELISETMGCEYCLPSDVAVLLLTSSNDLSLNSYNLHLDHPPILNCFISGYPKKSIEIEYCCPQM